MSSGPYGPIFLIREVFFENTPKCKHFFKTQTLFIFTSLLEDTASDLERLVDLGVVVKVDYKGNFFTLFGFIEHRYPHLK